VKSELIMTPIQNNQFRNIKAPNQYNSWIKSDSIMSSIRISQEVETNLSWLQVKIFHESNPNQSWVRTESVMTSSQNLSWFKYESIMSSIRISHRFKPYHSRLQVKINHYQNPNQSSVKSELIMTPIQNNQLWNTKAPNPY
jgi:hypothetical protein